MAKARARTKAKKKQATDRTWLYFGGGFAIVLVAIVAYGLLGGAGPVSAAQAHCNRTPDACVWVDDSGPGDGDKLRIIEVSDYACPACKSFNLDTAPALMEEYVHTGMVEWVVLPFALWETSIPAANASLCARDAGSFEEYHSLLFVNQEDPEAGSNELFFRLAEELNIRSADFESCVEDVAYEQQIRQNRRSSQVNSTPTFFIGDAIMNNMPLDQFRNVIGRAIADG